MADDSIIKKFAQWYSDLVGSGQPAPHLGFGTANSFAAQPGATMTPVSLPQNAPLPPPRPMMANAQMNSFAAQPWASMAPNVSLPQNPPMPMPRPQVPAGPPMSLAPPQNPMGLFARSAAMQTDPNTGQPINPQAAALAQAMMNRQQA